MNEMPSVQTKIGVKIQEMKDRLVTKISVSEARPMRVSVVLLSWIFSS